MGRYTGPICHHCRREGIKLCDKHKCASIRRNYPPGVHGKNPQGKPSDYAKQLREKQKARRIFGISEKQMQKYYREATASPEVSGEELIRQMELRFDNVVFRSGFASTRRQARQMVNHGLFTINGKKIAIPSKLLDEGDIFAVRENKRKSPLFADLAKKKLTPPKWIKVEPAEMQGQMIGRPEKSDLEGSIAPEVIIEFYSR